MWAAVAISPRATSPPETDARKMLARPVDSETVCERAPWSVKCSVVTNVTAAALGGRAGVSPSAMGTADRRMAGDDIMCAMTAAELWRRGQVGWPERFPVAQFPNAPLMTAIAGWGFAAVTDGTAHDAGRAVFTVGLSVW